MDGPRDFPTPMRLVVESYLDGRESFESAARRLAVLIRDLVRSTEDAPPGPPYRPPHVSVKRLSLSEWLDPRSFDAPVGELRVVPFVPGRPPEDERKAEALFQRACRLVDEIGGDAA